MTTFVSSHLLSYFSFSIVSNTSKWTMGVLLKNLEEKKNEKILCVKKKRSCNIRKHWSHKANRWEWIDKLHILDLQIQNHSKFVLHLLFHINLGRRIEVSICISTWTRNKTKKWLWFLWEWGISSFQGVPKIVVLTNYEDENNLHFFQKLKWATTLAPPSYVVPFGPQFIPSSSNLN